MTTHAHVILPGSQRHASRNARALGVANPEEWVEVTLKLRRKAPLPDVTDRPATILSREELGAKYGASDEDIATVKKAFEAEGLEIVDSNAATRTVRVGGPIHLMEQAFQVKLMKYAHDRGVFRGRTGVLQIPAATKDIVVGVFGLDTRPVVKPRGHATATAPVSRPIPPVTEHAKPTDKATARRRSWFYPAELASIYSFPPGDGSGQSIGVLEFGGGYFPADLQAFCRAANVSVPTVVPISVDGTPTNAHDGAEGEVMLDIEVIAGVCPRATIPAYFAPFTEQGWVDILDAAIHDNVNKPTVISISWGMAEDDPNWSQGAIDTINSSLKEAALAGITVLVASGDDGSGDQEPDGHAHVDFPSASPYVLSVGGTTLKIRSNKPVEVAWKDGDGMRNDGGGSTGGGVSVHFPRPTWQKVSIPSVNPSPIDGRVVPDVAADASANTGYFTVVDGQAEISGGTSASAPLWAALLGRINALLPHGKQVGYLTPVLYKTMPGATTTVGAASCTDITSGDNVTAHVGGYHTLKGYDAVTGWGSPIGTKLLDALKKVL